MPAAAGPMAATFGAPADDDCRRAGQVAAARGLPYRVVPFETDYVARHALETVWLTEGRQNPVDNITGCLMPSLRPAAEFVSGISAMARGHNAVRARLVPDWDLIGATDAGLESWLRGYAARPSLDASQVGSLFGDRGRELIALAGESFDRAVEGTRGMPALDRLDLYQVTERVGGYNCPGLNLASVWLGARAPYLTRRWGRGRLRGRRPGGGRRPAAPASHPPARPPRGTRPMGPHRAVAWGQRAGGPGREAGCEARASRRGEPGSGYGGSREPRTADRRPAAAGRAGRPPARGRDRQAPSVSPR